VINIVTQTQNDTHLIFRGMLKRRAKSDSIIIEN